MNPAAETPKKLPAAKLDVVANKFETPLTPPHTVPKLADQPTTTQLLVTPTPQPVTWAPVFPGFGESLPAADDAFVADRPVSNHVPPNKVAKLLDGEDAPATWDPLNDVLNNNS